MTNDNLSSKRKFTKKDGLFDKLRVHALDKHKVYKDEDVREAVKKLKDSMGKIHSVLTIDDANWVKSKIDKIFGEDLI